MVKNDEGIAPPLVSIGIASFNNSLYIEELLNSVKEQSYSAIELIVVDDCSTDNSSEIIRRWIEKNRYPVTFIQHKRNEGIVRTFSECTRLAQGRYISLVGSDDKLAPDMIALTVAKFHMQGISCGAVYADCRLIDSLGREISPSFIRYFNTKYADNPPEGNLIVPLLSGFYLPALTATVRREALDAVGEYDNSLFSEDLDMWLRISRKFSFAYLPLVLGDYRVHSNSAIHTSKISLNETYFRIYQKRYFEGPEEWRAAHRSLMEHAEHYYANSGPHVLSRLWLAFRETLSIKILFFLVLAGLGIKYETIKKLFMK